MGEVGWGLGAVAQPVAAGAGQPSGSWVPRDASPWAGWALQADRHLPWLLSSRSNRGCLNDWELGG